MENKLIENIEILTNNIKDLSLLIKENKDKLSEDTISKLKQFAEKLEPIYLK